MAEVFTFTAYGAKFGIPFNHNSFSARVLAHKCTLKTLSYHYQNLCLNRVAELLGEFCAISPYYQIVSDTDIPPIQITTFPSLFQKTKLSNTALSRCHHPLKSRTILTDTITLAICLLLIRTTTYWPTHQPLTITAAAKFLVAAYTHGRFHETFPFNSITFLSTEPQPRH